MTFVSARAANMTSGLLLEPIETPNSESSNSGQHFRPYSSANHHVTKGRYITSNDPRGYIPVYEYPLNSQWIMLDMDDGYVLWTGIWKALGNSKADIVKIIESQPDIALKLRRVRGGYLKIQGTWMPYEVALRLARRVAWPIRHELVPLFGPTFPSTCLPPDHPEYGQVVKPGTGRRRTRRTYPTTVPAETTQDWTVISPPTQIHADHSHSAVDPPFTYEPRRRPGSGPASAGQHLGSPVQLYMPYSLPPSTSSPPSPVADSALHASSSSRRYSPYVSTSSGPARQTLHPPAYVAHHGIPHDIRLPPLHTPFDGQTGRRRSIVALPPISTLDRRQPDYRDDSAAVLRRLQSRDDDEDFPMGPAHAYSPHGEASHSHATTHGPSFSTYSRSSPSTGHDTSSIDSPISPSLTTPVSGRSFFDDTARVAVGRSPQSPLSTGTGGLLPSGGGATTFKAGYHDDGHRKSAGPESHVGDTERGATALSWRPW